METNTTTAVALLPDRATKNVKPKPKRAEVIAALVELKRQEFNKECAENTKAFESAKADADKALADYVVKNIAKLKPIVDKGYCSNPHTDQNAALSISSVDVKFDLYFGDLPAAIKQKLEAYHRAATKKGVNSHYRHTSSEFDEKQVRREITEALNERAGLTTGDRVKKMLETPAIKKALTTLLADLNGENEPTAIAV